MTNAYMIASVTTSVVQLVALTIGLAMSVWTLGGIVLRLSGAWLTIAGLAAVALGQLAGLLIVLLGAALWALGHWHYALRHHTYKSPLARRVFLDLLPDRLDPTRNWETDA